MIGVVGAGVMGAALALQLARSKREVKLLATELDAAAADAMRAQRPHPGLGRVVPGVEVVDATEWDDELPKVTMVVVAVSSAGIVPVVERIREHVPPETIWAVATKGFDEDTLRSAAMVACDAVGDPARVVALVGPSLAAEVAAGVPTGLLAACEDLAAARTVAEAFTADGFRVDVGTDVAGVEVLAATKNVYAIAAGLCDGIAALEPGGAWTNTKAFVFSRALEEMAVLTRTLGGRVETVLGLAGAGDLFVTSLGGRNARFGRLVGEGLAPKRAIEQMRTTVEGYANARAAKRLAERHGLDLPLVRAVHAVLYEGASPRDALSAIVNAERPTG